MWTIEVLNSGGYEVSRCCRAWAAWVVDGESQNSGLLVRILGIVLSLPFRWVFGEVGGQSDVGDDEDDKDGGPVT